MNTILSGNVNSVGIRNAFGPHMELEILGTHGAGDSKLTLYRARTGTEVIETNGDPIFEGEQGFSEARELFIDADDCNL